MFEFVGESGQPAGCELKGDGSADRLVSIIGESKSRESACKTPASHPLLPHLEILSVSGFMPEPGTAHGALPFVPENEHGTTSGAGISDAAAFFRATTKKKHQFEVPRYLSAGAAPVEEKRTDCLPPVARRAGETRNILVSEIAFAFMLSLAGASRRRPDMELKITDQDDDEGTTPRDPGRLNLPEKERHAPVRQQWPSADKFSWTKAMRPLAATDSGIAFDAGSSPSSLFAGVELENRLAAVSVGSWWKNPTGDARSDTNRHSNTFAQGGANPNYRTRATMIVGLSDTLVEVARELFHDESLAWLIADLNKGSIREHIINGKRIVRLKHRQEIVLPTWLDVVDFNNARPEPSRSTKVVTLVEKTRVDIDLLKLGLTSVVGCTEDPTT
jgi:hypothetical protein